MKDTWSSRELPVLEAAVSLAEEGILLPEVKDIIERSGLESRAVALALLAMDGEYVDLQKTAGDPESWYLRAVKPGARRAVGQWPTPESLVEQLAAAFAEAADAEPDDEKESRLRQVAGFLTSTGRDIATDIVSKVILRSAGMG